MIRLFPCVLVAVVVFGCKSRPLGPYVSPRVSGQVLAADTHQPLPGVSVTRGSRETRSMSAPKGGELLMRKAPTRTDEQGRFELGNERVLSIVRGSGWNMVSLWFERSGYYPFQTNYAVNALTNTPGGEPLMDVGQVLLQPVEK